MIGLKKMAVLSVFALVLCPGWHDINAGETKKAVTTEDEKISYSLGYNIGQNLKRDFDVNVASFFQGFKESQEQGEPTLTQEEMKEAMTVFQNKMREKQMAQMKAAAQDNKAKGDEFLAANKGKEGVVTLESGLQYRVITAGDGATPKASDTVECHYRGTTIDGKEFDSSYKRGKPASFQVGGVIKGWTEALQLMKVGSKWELFIPSDLAYGDRGAGNAIAPGSTLLFEVELLGIK
ncbi:FKBP-type peptidyl-prolyl cis-trans isomerase FklB [Desulfocicer vacuolatum DSM 3385]|uniref:Peptidyl-prolyl cis-trans isomerase n=1 Tax=Desulfocicer vacuolatum DSM 3385 TaxID=1121400 RepID=A0A1W2A3N5_9BACT|nr:FKBP-type peptidyl-prolyl cis-trans isomerase [Desulfocicer vacuolatum]SMC55062.1 FKBP-type peptidyl-prolyl cis-trans isomerase FklB [Desulfocicer vacuolatum DSM 3385]